MIKNIIKLGKILYYNYYLYKSHNNIADSDTSSIEDDISSANESQNLNHTGDETIRSIEETAHNLQDLDDALFPRDPESENFTPFNDSCNNLQTLAASWFTTNTATVTINPAEEMDSNGNFIPVNSQNHEEDDDDSRADLLSIILENYDSENNSYITPEMDVVY